MTIELSEDEMRNALFGTTKVTVSPNPIAPAEVSAPDAAPTTHAPIVRRGSAAKRSGGYRVPKLRVTLHAAKEYEGEADVFVHETSTLSKLVAEHEAKTAAKKKKYKYLEVISIESMS